MHHVLREHLETFLEDARACGDGEGLPAFVERELREFLSCGVLSRGFARFRCDGCGHEILVAFSCKGRGFCPSCCGRRMADLAAHLADDVLGGLPVRQWVLTLPYRLRYALAWNHELCRAVLGVFIRALSTFERRRAERRGVLAGRSGAVTAIQRFGSALNLNVHFHTLAVEGVFVDEGIGHLRFVPNPEPTGLEVAKLLASICRRIRRLVKRRGIELDRPSGEVDDLDPLASASPHLTGICAASVLGRVATGVRAGQPVLRVGRDPDAPWVTVSSERQAHVAGFDLHANVAVPAGNRTRLEHLARYVLRPPIAQDALELTGAGRILLTMRRPWHDGTRAILFEPSELIEKLAALIPKPRVNLLLYHGILGPSARLRGAAVAAARALSPSQACAIASGLEGEAAPRPPVVSVGPAAPSRPLRDSERGEAMPGSESATPRPSDSVDPSHGKPPSKPRTHTHWADLLRRTFEIDVLACPGCGGRLRLLATIEEPEVVRKILSHLGIPAECPEPLPARAPPLEPSTFLPEFFGDQDG